MPEVTGIGPSLGLLTTKLKPTTMTKFAGRPGRVHDSTLNADAVLGRLGF